MSPRLKLAVVAVVLLLFAAGAAAVFALPRLVVGAAREAARERFGATLECGASSASPFAVTLTDVRLVRPGVDRPVEIGEIVVSPSLLHALSGSIRVKRLRVRGVRWGLPARDRGGADASRGETGEPADPGAPGDPGEPGEPGGGAVTGDGEGVSDAILEKLRRFAALLAREGTVEIEDARFDLSDGTPPLVVERAELQRIPGGLRARGRITDAGGVAAWNLDLDPQHLHAEGEVAVDDFPLVNIASFLPELPWHDERSARVDARIEVHGVSPDDPARLDARVSVTNLWLASRRLAKEPIGPLDVDAEGRGAWDLRDNVLELSDGRVALNGAAVTLEGRVRPSLDRYLLDLDLAMPETPCDDIFRAVPDAVLEPFGAFDWRGALTGTARLFVDAEDLAATDFGVRLNNRCVFTRTPWDVDATRFRGPFPHEVPSAGGGTLVLHTGPGTEQWTPIERVSPFLIHAVLAHEDAGFFDHEGIAPYAIEEALGKNLERGRFAFGASTISMQLAKNLFLSRDKTLARKVREIVLTWWLEEKFSKTEILELYLNVIEYGPDTYGISNATRRYFGCEPADVSLAQAAYLATVLPAPARYDARNFAGGELSGRTRGEIEFLLRHMARRGRVTDAARDAALAELDDFAFSRPGPGWRPGLTAELPLAAGPGKSAGFVPSFPGS